MSIIIVDVQTGGLDANVHSLLGVGLIKCTSNFEVMDQLEFNIKHSTMQVQPEALSYNRLDIRNYNGWLSEKTAKRAFFKFLGAPEDLWKGTSDFPEKAIPKHRYAGMNVTFDIPFVKAFVTTEAFNSIFTYIPYDVLNYYDLLYRVGVVEEAKTNRLYDIARALGVNVDKDNLEQASPLYCADIARRAFRKLDRRADKLSTLVTKHGYSVKGLLETNQAVAKTKRKSLMEARDKITKQSEAEEAEGGE